MEIPQVNVPQKLRAMGFIFDVKSKQSRELMDIGIRLFRYSYRQFNDMLLSDNDIPFVKCHINGNWEYYMGLRNVKSCVPEFQIRDRKLFLKMVKVELKKFVSAQEVQEDISLQKTGRVNAKKR